MFCTRILRLSIRNTRDTIIFGTIVLVFVALFLIKLSLFRTGTGLKKLIPLEVRKHEGNTQNFSLPTGVQFPSANFTDGENRAQTKQNCSQSHQPPTNETCPQCFSKEMKKIESLLVEFKPENEPSLGEPAGFFTPGLFASQNLVTDYLLAPSYASKTKCPFLLILHPCLLHEVSKRNTSRQTWASVNKEQKWPNQVLHAEVKVIFVVGHDATTPPANESGQTIVKDKEDGGDGIETEANQNDDILYLNMTESSTNLTLKILSAFKWVEDQCPCVRFVLKVEEDTFVNVPLLVNTLLTFGERLDFAVVGFVYNDQNLVQRVGRWGVSQSAYSLTRYPPYLSGRGYLLSAKVLFRMAETATVVPIFNVEDAFITGVLRRMVACQMFSLGYMFTHLLDTKWSNCQMVRNEKIVGTNVDEKRQKEIWQTIVNGTGC